LHYTILKTKSLYLPLSYLNRKDEFEKGWIEDQAKELREVKLLPEDADATGMMFLFDNKISFIAPHDEEGVGFLIESDWLSKTMKSIFDALWKISKDTTNYSQNN